MGSEHRSCFRRWRVTSSAIVHRMPEVHPQSGAGIRRQAIEVEDRVSRFIRQLSKFQQERLCRSLSLTSSQSSYASILTALEKDGSLRPVTQLTNLSREVVMDFFQEVAGVQQLDRDVLRQLPMNEMRHWLEQVLLQVRLAASQTHHRAIGLVDLQFCVAADNLKSPQASTNAIVNMQGCSGLVEELNTYVQTRKTSSEKACHLVSLCDAKCWSHTPLLLLCGVAQACLVCI